MKKYISIIIILMFCIACQAQDKLFQEGLQNGRSPQKFYFAKNGKGKGITLEKMKQFADKHDYLLGKYTTKQIDRFGDKQTALDGVYFIPKKEYPRYVFEYDGGGFDENMHRGSCWLFIERKFIKFENVRWSGNIENGMLDGQGSAFWFDDAIQYFITVNGKFQHGLPLGNMEVKRFSSNSANPETVSFKSQGSINVGALSDGLASYSVSGGKWGFVSSDGTITISPSYESIVKEFANGKAEVILDGKEIIINKNGKYVDLTANQKRLDAQQLAKERQEELKRQQEEKRKEIARRQEEIEKRRLAEEAAKIRIEKFRNCQPGDIVYYSQDWVHSELFGWIREEYTMRVTCFVERNVNNGERLQIRVGNVESSNRNYYSSPEIDGIKYNKGDVLWIRPLDDSRWQIQ